jgi:hypothetical protein
MLIFLPAAATAMRQAKMICEERKGIYEKHQISVTFASRSYQFHDDEVFF